ncbi:MULTISPECIES: class I SAM-dependent methyltransferase [Pseudothermotoga]|jgi:hypothetical protein|uniref:class I SAM-dependent methyltransferase n=1 Tax=Pseudothermotoga TaxID=1643951 RepID=UPI0003F4CBA2|nr:MULTISPECIES: class I SAM-dependent methyltransferase [Pseudothermotoga]KUK21229.1 MAG: Uncharacterized protein XD56_0844 [Pseudothermotoga lettingae]MDI3493992.1 hypothetical protein [Pseudothermotoga sp.]MDK2884483.1 hypothetical protein [Pseudothermotoga sp.]HBT25104.1 methyltransferase [Pseudothermotoga sp.]
MIFITTSHDPVDEQIDRAKALSNDLNITYISRKHCSNLELFIQNDYCYVVEKDRIVVRWKDGQLFFHPSMAKVRMKNLQRGLKDHLIESLDLKGNELVLDTTLGLATEAILMAAFLESGKIVGVEGSLPIYVIVRDGLSNYKSNLPWINAAMKKIELIHADFKQFIRSLPDNSYDIVYCDPMFENPVYESSSMNPLRPFALYDTIDQNDVNEMLRVARKKLVLKAHAKDSLFERIKVDSITGSRKSCVFYGVIYKK